MRLPVGPIWRIAGAVVAWLLFTFFFSLLFQSAGVVMGLGGSCASGGPYVVEVECPDAVVAWTPLSIFGGLLAVAIGLLVQRGFAAPVIVWAWPVLFIGLGVQFFGAGGPVGIIIGLLFVLMGAAPLIIEVRGGLRRLLLGKTDAHDRRFAERENAPRSLYAMARADAGAAVVPTPRDAVLALVCSLPPAALGVWLGVLVFAASARA